MDFLVGDGILCYVFYVLMVKLLDVLVIEKLVCRFCLVVMVEEYIVIGGLGSVVIDVLVEWLDGWVLRMWCFGIFDVFVSDYGN